MTRSFLFVAITMMFVGSVTAQGCKASGVGDPCIPEQEYDVSFAGFNRDEVNVESKSFQCQTRLCLVNHFRGRVTCPYGQDKDGNAPPGAETCKVPGSDKAVSGKDSQGNFVDKTAQATVRPQCTDRTPDKAVYCSCRCANVDGRTDDGASYCSCPDGFKCQQLVSSIGALDTGLTGAYCVKSSDNFDRNNNCAKSCDPATAKCD